MGILDSTIYPSSHKKRSWRATNLPLKWACSSSQFSSSYSRDLSPIQSPQLEIFLSHRNCRATWTTASSIMTSIYVSIKSILTKWPDPPCSSCCASGGCFLDHKSTIDGLSASAGHQIMNKLNTTSLRIYHQWHIPIYRPVHCDWKRGLKGAVCIRQFIRVDNRGLCVKVSAIFTL